MIDDPEQTAPVAKAAPDRPERANTRSRRTRQAGRALFFGITIAALAVAGTWYWISRERPPDVLAIATGPAGSDSYTLMREAAEVVERHSQTLRLEIRATRDASQNIALLNAKQIDAAVIRSDTPVFSDIRSIADLYADLFHIIVRADAPAASINAIARVSISIPYYDTANFRSFWAVGDHYDLPIADFAWKAEPLLRGIERLLSGDVDALFAVRSIRDRQLVRMFEDAQLTGLRLRYIAIGQAEAIAIKRPFLTAASIPMGAFTGANPVPAADTQTLGVSRVLVTRSDVDERPVRELTRILFEHRKDLTLRFALAASLAAPDPGRGLSVPMHDGARAFYERDEPSFVQENAEPLALLVTVLTVLISSLIAVRRGFVASQKNRADIYNYQLLDIQKRATESTDGAQLAGMKREINAVLETVVRALDTDEVSDEGFQSFSLLWEAVRETINDRIAELDRDRSAKAPPSPGVALGSRTDAA